MCTYNFLSGYTLKYTKGCINYSFIECIRVHPSIKTYVCAWTTLYALILMKTNEIMLDRDQKKSCVWVSFTWWPPPHKKLIFKVWVRVTVVVKCIDRLFLFSRRLKELAHIQTASLREVQITFPRNLLVASKTEEPVGSNCTGIMGHQWKEWAV